PARPISSPEAPTVPIHPELLDDDSVLWVLPAALVPGRGAVTRAPHPFADWIAAGQVRMRWEAGGVVVRLGEGEHWIEWAEPVRLGLLEALGGEWETAEEADLGAVLDEVLAGEVGEFIASHGGRVRVVEVRGSDATLELSGTCGDCPLRGITLQNRIGAAVRERFPDLGELAVVTPPGARLPFFR
ncbi:MAG: NifU family protein, partial [bacterium]|nr:NifU family protein [bacterium]